MSVIIDKTLFSTWPKVIKLFSWNFTGMLNIKDFSCFQTLRFFIYHAQTIVGTLTFMSMINFMLNCVEHEKSFQTRDLNIPVFDSRLL